MKYDYTTLNDDDSFLLMPEEMVDALEDAGFDRRRIENNPSWRTTLLELAVREARANPIVRALLVERDELFDKVDHYKREANQVSAEKARADRLERQLKQSEVDHQSAKLRADLAATKLEDYQQDTELERKLGARVIALAEENRKLVSIQRDLHLFKKDDEA